MMRYKRKEQMSWESKIHNAQRSTHLKDMKPLVLHHLALVLEEVHAELEVGAAVDVGHHDLVVGPIEQDLTQQLDRLSFGDVALRLHQNAVVLGEEEVEIDVEVVGQQRLVLGENILFFVGVGQSVRMVGGFEISFVG